MTALSPARMEALFPVQERPRRPDATRRRAELARFLDQAGLAAAQVVPLAADASFRHYHRLQHEGQSLVLMDAPPPVEDVRPFLRVGSRLVELGFSAPRILAADAGAGFVLLEDLGDDTFTRLLARGTDEAALYRLATDVLITLHGHDNAVPEGSPAYDHARLREGAALLLDWYLPAMTHAPVPPEVRAAYLAAWDAVLPLAFRVPQGLVLRDFHVDNLLRLPGREGFRACGLLDFQDAALAPVTYDVMSLLEDARRDVDPAVVAAERAHYLAAFPELDPEDFAVSWAVLAAQRHARVIGVFTRLCKRDHKPHYLAHLPRLWRLMENALAHPALAPLTAWFDTYCPPPLRGVPLHDP